MQIICLSWLRLLLVTLGCVRFSLLSYSLTGFSLLTPWKKGEVLLDLVLVLCLPLVLYVQRLSILVEALVLA